MSVDGTFNPLVTIVGATGTGKSKLAVELAKRFNGEVINGDAMQIYKGLPVITNKISPEEREGISHHILDQIGIEEQPWLVNVYQRQARKTIREIRSRGRLPILVGGTHYYTEAVLFNQHLQSPDDGLEDSEDGWEAQDRRDHPILQAPTSEILAKLREVDPEMASRWHPSDRRKIVRSLEIWLQTGLPASKIYRDQSQQRLAAQAGSDPSPVLAYSSLVFWLRAQGPSLKDRLDTRVDQMIANGLITEARSILTAGRDLTAAGRDPDRTRGIWISIGVKEMEPYFDASEPLSSSPNPDPDALEKTKQTCINSIKTATRRYARYQERWLLNHFPQRLMAANALTSTLFVLDTTDPVAGPWETHVSRPATHLTTVFLAGETPSLPVSPGSSSLHDDTMQEIREHLSARAADKEGWGARYCEDCDKTLMTEKQWVTHLQGKGHRRVVRGREKREGFERWKSEKKRGQSPKPEEEGDEGRKLDEVEVK